MKNWRQWDHTKLILFAIGLIAVICGIVLVVVLNTEKHWGAVTLVVGKVVGLLGFSRNGAKKNTEVNKEALLMIREIKMDCRETKLFVRENRQRITTIETHLLKEKGKEYRKEK